jgi:hypothetical protein
MLAHPFTHSLDEFLSGAWFGAGLGTGHGLGLRRFGGLLAHFHKTAFHFFAGALSGEASTESAALETAMGSSALESAMLRSGSVGGFGFWRVFASLVGLVRFLVLILLTVIALVL